jgi:mannitol-specific phosphotransferase system IIBC component
MQRIGIVAAVFVSGCVSIELPNVVSDTAKVTRETYKELTSRKAEPAKAPARRVLAHSYVGKDSETVAEIRQVCVNEAAQKLSLMGVKDVRYSVQKNEIVTLNNSAVANCELALED